MPLVASSDSGHSLTYRCITSPYLHLYIIFFSLSSPPLSRTPAIGFRVHPKSRMISSHDHLLCLQEPHFQIRLHSEVLGDMNFGGTLFNPLQSLWSFLTPNLYLCRYIGRKKIKYLCACICSSNVIP